MSEDPALAEIRRVILNTESPYELENLRSQFENGYRETMKEARALIKKHQTEAISIRALFETRRMELKRKAH